MREPLKVGRLLAVAPGAGLVVVVVGAPVPLCTPAAHLFSRPAGTVLPIPPAVRSLWSNGQLARLAASSARDAETTNVEQKDMIQLGAAEGETRQHFSLSVIRKALLLLWGN